MKAFLIPVAMRPLFRSRLLHPLGALMLALSLVLSPPAAAHVDDAHSMCMEIAAPYVEKGFIVRQDYSRGEIKSGQTRRIRAQLFKGNEYWIFLGSDRDGVEFELQVLDAKGKSIAAETKKIKGAIGVRVLPPRTGSYQVTFTLKFPGNDPADWALVTAYR